MFEVSWGLPELKQDNDGCIVSDNTMTHVVLKYTDGEQHIIEDVTKSPHCIRGTEIKLFN